jgi:hypothetical protein
MTQVLTPRSVKMTDNSNLIGSHIQNVHEFSFGTPKDFNVPGLKLPALATVLIDVREVTLHRNSEGIFKTNML